MAASYQNDDQARKTNFSTTIFGGKLIFFTSKILILRNGY